MANTKKYTEEVISQVQKLYEEGDGNGVALSNTEIARNFIDGFKENHIRYWAKKRGWKPFYSGMKRNSKGSIVKHSKTKSLGVNQALGDMLIELVIELLIKGYNRTKIKISIRGLKEKYPDIANIENLDYLVTLATNKLMQGITNIADERIALHLAKLDNLYTKVFEKAFKDDSNIKFAELSLKILQEQGTLMGVNRTKISVQNINGFGMSNNNKIDSDKDEKHTASPELVNMLKELKSDD